MEISKLKELLDVLIVDIKSSNDQDVGHDQSILNALSIDVVDDFSFLKKIKDLILTLSKSDKHQKSGLNIDQAFEEFIGTFNVLECIKVENELLQIISSLCKEFEEKSNLLDKLSEQVFTRLLSSQSCESQELNFNLKKAEKDLANLRFRLSTYKDEMYESVFCRLEKQFKDILNLRSILLEGVVETKEDCQAAISSGFFDESYDDLTILEQDINDVDKLSVPSSLSETDALSVILPVTLYKDQRFKPISILRKSQSSTTIVDKKCVKINTDANREHDLHDTVLDTLARKSWPRSKF